MTEHDLPTIQKLAQQLGYETANLANRFQQIANDPNHALFVARDENQNAIAFAHVLKEPDSLLSEHRAQLTALVVDENHRNQHVGKQLLQKAEEWARDSGHKQLRLTTNIKRELAHRFYERNGYETQKTQHSMIKTLS